eukprot:TRINITY_DN3700_c0_g2_i2.p1 TRINITY_DN3700_c0_g2~~TRINITY_DN3700_c0_g2_i2.p1  ORF type:complete len:442 (+),score=151.93 TRINITY_DN3700_c0_g2_i2:54-1379(+)
MMKKKKNQEHTKLVAVQLKTISEQNIAITRKDELISVLKESEELLSQEKELLTKELEIARGDSSRYRIELQVYKRALEQLECEDETKERESTIEEEDEDEEYEDEAEEEYWDRNEGKEEQKEKRKDGKESVEEEEEEEEGEGEEEEEEEEEDSNEEYIEEGEEYEYMGNMCVVIPSSTPLENYIRLKKEIGNGSFGTIYRGRDRLKRTVAIKSMDITSAALDSEEGLEKILNEVRIQKRLKHVNVLPIYDIFSHGDFYYITMPFISEPPPLSQCKDYMKQILEGLKYLHEEALVIHRDIKAENVLIDDNVCKICDFGESITFTSSDPFVSGHCGSRAYQAIEIMRGDEKYNMLVDCWSVGVLFFFLLTLDFPWTANLEEDYTDDDLTSSILMICASRELSKILEETPGIQPAAKQLLKGLLAVNPEKRYHVNQALESQWFL